MKVKLTVDQVKLIKNELSYDLKANAEFDLPDDKADKIFDRCVEIEVEESNIEEDEEMSQQGETAASLVTMLGGH
jgi:hypothetical protein